jgi:hypothetical protein
MKRGRSDYGRLGTEIDYYSISPLSVGGGPLIQLRHLFITAAPEFFVVFIKRIRVESRSFQLEALLPTAIIHVCRWGIHTSVEWFGLYIPSSPTLLPPSAREPGELKES